jgi:hypothetical protein
MLLQSLIETILRLANQWHHLTQRINWSQRMQYTLVILSGFLEWAKLPQEKEAPVA